MTKSLAYSAVLSAVAVSPALAQMDDDFLADMSLEELLDLEVSSAAKKPQNKEDAASAIFVITDEDIRASGVSTIADALRMAPGVEVTEVDNRVTGVAIRGFNWYFTNKLQVLIDGREVYQPSSGGIYWDSILVPMEDIKRIEIVRGPNATIWGPIAVNGVINIVTKHAVDTLNTQVTVEASTHDRHRIYARKGFSLGDIGAMRVYGEARTVPSLVDSQGEAFNDGGEISQLGFRLDLEPNYSDTLTLQGDFQNLEADLTQTDLFFGNLISSQTEREDGASWNILGRWQRKFSDTNILTTQSYFTRTERTDFEVDLRINSFNADISHYFAPTPWLDVVYGVAYRHLEDETFGTARYSYDPDRLIGDWTSLFAQIDLTLIPDRFNVIVGARTEDSTYADWATQPTIRAIWTGEDDWSVWSAVSNAKRPPGRIETSTVARLGVIPPGTPLINPSELPLDLRLVGNPDYAVEDMIAYEMGFRKQWDDGASLDIAAYQQVYDKQLLIDFPPYQIVPDETFSFVIRQDLVLDNSPRGGRVSGVEIAYSREMSERWDVSLAGNVHDNDMKVLVLPGVDQRQSYGDSPNWQLSLRNDFEISSSIDASIWLRHVPELDLGNAPGYTDLDLRFSWRPNDTVELTLVGENLLDDRRQEIDALGYPSPTGFVERRVVGKLGVRF